MLSRDDNDDDDDDEGIVEDVVDLFVVVVRVGDGCCWITFSHARRRS